FGALARLAQRHARTVAIVAVLFAVLAGVLGGSVAKRLDPYGAEDPSTESVKGQNQLEEAGYRFPDVVALVEDTPVARPATRARVEALEQEVRRNPEVDKVVGYYDTRSRAFVSEDGDSTYFVVTLKPTGDKETQDVGGEIADSLSAHPGVTV